ncbi:hypothetical protein D3875_03570 [Deinococcus cavernae]|uniref:Uncharacterized protein n=1 Tax=Deinococcus cavernae TaxID=2320857 RepID=A0A418VEU6_9DEIO|nr:hypothetical protein [Deinococcus cavernae]RJF74633.1 hypothetical protein D3875_03570 [Deinococcus cavernae]
MPKFLLTTDHGLSPQTCEILTAPHLAKARAEVLKRYPQARAYQIGTPRPYNEEFSLRFDDPSEQYAHLTLSFTIHREDTAPYQMHAHRVC